MRKKQGIVWRDAVEGKHDITVTRGNGVIHEIGQAGTQEWAELFASSEEMFSQIKGVYEELYWSDDDKLTAMRERLGSLIARVEAGTRYADTAKGE